MIQAKEIVYAHPSALKPNPANRNIHPPEQIERLVKLINYQGFRAPVVVSNRSGLVVAGHGRLMAAKKIGLEEIPVTYQDFLDEAQEIAYGVSDNAVGAWAELDMSNILADIGGLDKGFDFDLFGIKNLDMSSLEPEAEGDPDEVPDTPVEPQSKLGDLYILGQHRLLCGDSTNINDVESLLNNQKIDMVFTDPPYGMNAVSKEGKVGGDTKNAPAKIYKPVLGDEDTSVAKDACAIILSLKIEKVFIWGGNYFTDFLPPSPCWIVWDKQRPEGLTFADGEVAWTNLTTPLKFLRHRWDGYHKASEKGQDRVHPTQKPAYLAEWTFNEYGEKEDNVLDLFGGSGSTLIGCEKTNRNCFMMELDPNYVDVIVSRYCKYTKQNKVKLNGEEIEWNAD